MCLTLYSQPQILVSISRPLIESLVYTDSIICPIYAYMIKHLGGKWRQLPFTGRRPGFISPSCLIRPAAHLFSYGAQRKIWEANVRSSHERKLVSVAVWSKQRITWLRKLLYIESSSQPPLYGPYLHSSTTRCSQNQPTQWAPTQPWGLTMSKHCSLCHKSGPRLLIHRHAGPYWPQSDEPHSLSLLSSLRDDDLSISYPIFSLHQFCPIKFGLLAWDAWGEQWCLPFSVDSLPRTLLRRDSTVRITSCADFVSVATY